MDYELAIIGAGAAGYSASVYAGRSGIKTIVFDKAMGGGLGIVSPKIENYPGFESISGIDLMEKMKKHASKYADIHFNEEVKKADGNTIEIKREFLWPKDKKEVEIRVPVEGVKESFRSIEHVSPEEISNAMFLAAKHSLGLKEETLLNETASLLGFKRMGSNINETLKSIFDEDIKSGKLAQNGNLIIASQS